MGAAEEKTAAKEGSMEDSSGPFQASWKAAMYSTGIVLSLVTYSYCQERIMTKPYMTPTGQARFTDTVFLVLVNRLAAAVAAAMALVVTSGWKGLAPQAPIERFPVVSLANLLATTCQYEALKWITLPTQTLLKCSKLIPVMILSAVISKKKYVATDYVSAALVGGGTVAFMNGDISSRVATQSDSWIGLVLMLGNVGFDSFLMAYQERLFMGYGLSSNNQMLYVNLFSSILAFGFCLRERAFAPSFSILALSSQFRIDLFLLTAGAVSAQFFITGAIKNFGAVFFGTVVTIQQVASVVVSSMVLGTKLSPSQWLACGVVFSALFARNIIRAVRSLRSVAAPSLPTTVQIVKEADEFVTRKLGQMSPSVTMLKLDSAVQ